MKNVEKNESFAFTKGGNSCWMKVKYVKLFYQECPGGFYSLQRGFATGLDINKRTACLSCPSRAFCENGKVKAKENFWGLKISTVHRV